MKHHVINTFDTSNFHMLCNALAKKDAALQAVLDAYGYPPLWSRQPNFATLIHIILEQQVSLASAKAAFVQLRNTLGTITPQQLLLLSDEELKACYFSRQKIVYARHLSQAVIEGQLVIEQLEHLPNQKVQEVLLKIKGIGLWTADVFMMMCLHRCDCFPLGDIALIKSVKEVKDLPATTSKEQIELLAQKWKPYRTIAAFMLWHAYLQKRNIVYQQP
jgi:DNA-3-methyladenine glycosylase II